MAATPAALKVAGDRVVGFEPRYDFPFNRGKLCPKGVKRYLQDNHPDRLLDPLVRTPAGFEPVSWDEALGRTVRNLQASWVKMGLDAATESLRWGVNDLGGTLMEENISRLAGSYHGVKLDPPDLIAAAHRAGRPAAERTTLYGIRRRYELEIAA